MSAAPAPDAKAPITHRGVFRIAYPIVLSNATVPILGAVDTGVVGQMGAAAPIGAVGLGAVILSTIYWIFGFLRMGTVGLTSQALGAGDRAEMSAILTRALLVGFTVGIVMILAQIPVFHAALSLAPATDEVEALTREYLTIRIWSAPAAIGIYGLTGWLIAQERTKAVLWIQLWMNGLNMALDVLFVLGFGWGVGGVAVATLIAEWSGLALALWLCRDAFVGPDWRNRAQVLNPAPLKRMMLVSTDILIRSALLMTIFTSFQFVGAGLGDVPLAANQVLMQFLMITAYAMDGFAFAAETLVGQAMGAGQRARLRRAALVTSHWGLATVLALALAFALLGGPIIDLMTTAEDVRAEARSYLIWMVLAPPVGVAAWMLDGIFIGATRTRDMRNMMLVSFVIYCAAVAVLVPWLGNHGLWVALLISFAARGITLWLRYPALEEATEKPATA